MLLILTASDDATADYLCERLFSRQTHVRLNTDEFPRPDTSTSFGRNGTTLRLGSETLTPSSISTIWYRRPKPISVSTDADEAQALHLSREWASALNNFLEHVEPRRWMNHPSANARASNKLLQLSVAAQVGLRVPDTLVTTIGADARAFFDAHGGRIIIKPLSSGYVETANQKVSALIYTSKVSAADLEDDALLAQCPSLFQREITKNSDVRLTAVDGRLCALAQLPVGSHTDIDIRRHDVAEINYRPIEVPVQVRDSLSKFMSTMRLRFGAFDFAIDSNGEWWFLEVNPNGQWAWTDLLGQSEVWQMFADAFASRS